MGEGCIVCCSKADKRGPVSVQMGFIVHFGSSPTTSPFVSAALMPHPHLTFDSVPPPTKGERAHHTPPRPRVSPEKACTSHSTTQTYNHTHRRFLELPVNPPSSLSLHEVNFTPSTRPPTYP